MKAPDKIYIAETPNKLIEIWSEEPIEPKPYITEHEYIRKGALLEWAMEKKKRLGKMLDAMPATAIGAKLDACKEFIDKIESL